MPHATESYIYIHHGLIIARVKMLNYQRDPNICMSCKLHLYVIVQTMR